MPRTSPPVVLVVEDEALVRDYIATFLRDVGYPVLETDTAEHAIAMMDTGTRIDIVLTDINLNGKLTASRTCAKLKPFLRASSRQAGLLCRKRRRRRWLTAPYWSHSPDRACSQRSKVRSYRASSLHGGGYVAVKGSSITNSVPGARRWTVILASVC